MAICLSIFLIPFNFVAAFWIYHLNEGFSENRKGIQSKPISEKENLTEIEAEAEIENLRFLLSQNHITKDEYLRRSQDIKDKVKK